MLASLGYRFAGLSGAQVLGLWLLGAALLLLLHLRQRQQRRQILVSSSALWEQLAGLAPAAHADRRAWRWWWPPGNFWLQLLVVTALALAAGEPTRIERPGRSLAILVDCSASMGTDDGRGAGSRLALARQQARALIDGLGPGDQALLIQFAHRPVPLAGWTADRARLLAALDGMAVLIETGAPERALALARQSLRGRRAGQVVMFTDQARTAEAGGSSLPPLQTVVVGQPTGNLALRALTAIRAAGDQEQVLAEALVTNFGDRPAAVRLAVRPSDSRGGPILVAAERQLPAGASAVVPLPFRNAGEISIEAAVEGPRPGIDNGLALDDRARGLVPAVRLRRVLVVGAGNLYLAGALLSFGSDLTVETLDPAAAERRRPEWPLYDLVIFDGWAPQPGPAAGHYLFLPAAGKGGGDRAIANPLADRVDRDHPLMRQLALADLNIKRALPVVPAAEDQVPLAAGRHPLILARAQGRLRQVTLTFDPRQSDLPLRPAFPLLLANVLDWTDQAVKQGAERPLAPSPLDAREQDTRQGGQKFKAAPAPPASARRRLPAPPAVVLLALALLGSLLTWGRSASGWWRGRAGGGSGLTTLLRALTLAVIVLALVGPSARRASSARSLAILADLSASVDPAGQAQARQALEQLAARASNLGEQMVVHPFRFAGQTEALAADDSWAARAFPDPSDGAGLAPLDAGRTDLGGALHTALAALAPDRIGRVLLLSDGRDTEGGVSGAIQRATAGRIPIHTWSLPARPPPPMALAGLRVAGGTRQGSSFDLEAVIHSQHPGRVRLRLEQLRPAATARDEERTLVAGANLIALPAQIDQEPMVFRLGAQPLFAGSNEPPAVTLLGVAAEPPPRVLVLEPTAGSCLPLRRALEAEKMRVESGRRLPGPGQLAALDLLVLCDLPPGGLPAAQLPELLAFVRERGGGLLVTGGLEGWGAGAYQGTALEPLLPLEHLPPARKEEATTALALVIDRSGSMSGPKIELAKEAARASAALMNPLDLIAVIAFDSQASTLVRLQPASNRQRILGDIGSLRSGGGTNVLAGLREAVAELQSAEARRKHIILLSDGQSPAEGLTDLVDEAVSARITLSAVGVGDGADLPLLQMIAGRGGGRFHRSRDPSSLPRIFSRETAEVTSSADDPRGIGLRLARPAEALTGVALASAPPLFGHSRGRERPGAEVLLRTDRGAPLLARWQQGLGQVMIWSGDFSSRWSGEWLAWRSFTRLWGQVSRSMMLRRGAESLPLAASRNGDEVLVQVRAFDADDHPRRSLLGTVVVREVLPDGSLRLRPAPEPALLEGAPGEYQAHIPAGDAAALMLEAHLRHPERPGPGWQARGELALLPPPETQPAGPGLATLARSTGGQVLSGDIRPLLEVGPQRAWTRVPLRRWLALAALILFLAAITPRRATFRALA